MRVPHEFDLAYEAIAQFSTESKVKVESKVAGLMLYDYVKDSRPKQMKVSPISEIPHKSKEFWSILDLLFSSRLIPHGHFPYVNKNSEKTAPEGAID